MTFQNNPKYITKVENGVLLYQKNPTKYSYHDDTWRMITDQRYIGKVNSEDYEKAADEYEVKILDTFDHIIRDIEQTSTNSIICPYCEDESEPEGCDYQADGEERHCYECDNDFLLSADFGYGFTTKILGCQHLNRPHKYRFDSQYYYDSRTWRVSKCVYCNDSYLHVSGRDKPTKTLLPWKEEYNDENYFDPEGVLKVEMHRSEYKPTPILDELCNPRVRYGYATVSLRAIEKSEQIHGV